VSQLQYEFGQEFGPENFRQAGIQKQLADSDGIDAPFFAPYLFFYFLLPLTYSISLPTVARCFFPDVSTSEQTVL